MSVLSEAYQTEPGGVWAMTAWMGWDSPYPATGTGSACAFFLIRSLKRLVDLWLGFVKLLEAEKREGDGSPYYFFYHVGAKETPNIRPCHTRR